MTGLPDEPATAPCIDLVVQSIRWGRRRDIEPMVRRVIAEAARGAAGRPVAETELTIVLTDDAAVRDLNRTWRGIDKPTNVLSFPAGPVVGTARPAPIGDVVIAFETAVREAGAEGKPLDHHVAHLLVHGYLHLLGYDHDADDDAEAMEHLERDILARLDIPDPYVVETGADRHA